MQLFVNNAVWDNWEPAFGLGADFLDEQEMAATGDFAEGVMAFAQKRRAGFQGA